MNWVGGSRTRVLIKQERRKQKEYFEKNKLKSKMKLLGVFSPVKNTTASLDLLNLYMVNQISSKKETPEIMKRPTYVNMNRDLKIPLRKHDLELPMSPHCVPSKLCIDDMGKNVPYQRLCSKEETGPVQSSQDMNSYRMFHKTENYSYIPPSFPSELPSNRHIPSQNSTPRIAPNPWKCAYEEKQNEQFSNGNFSDPLFSKLHKRQDIFSPSQRTAEFGASYERIRSSETGDFFTRRSVIMGENCGSLYERRQPDFAMEKTSVQKIWGNNGKEFSNFLEDVSQPTQRHLSYNHNSDTFVSHNMIQLLSRDQPGRMAAFPKCAYDGLSGTCVASSDGSHSSSGVTSGNFTVPQVALPNPPLNTSYLGTCQSKKRYQKESNSNEIREFRSLEEDCHPARCGRKGNIESDDQEEALQRNTWEYPVCSMGNIPLKELHHKQSCDFDHNEMEERRMCPLKGRAMSTEKIYLESSQSSQSASYSPRPTESTFSSSSDLISEDEDQIQQQIEDSNKKATETTDNLEKVEDHLGDIIVKDSVKIHNQNDNIHQSSVKNDADQCPESQCNSEQVSQKQTNNDCVLPAGRCDVGVQTEKELGLGKTAEAAVQCTILCQCSCQSWPDVPVEEEPSLQEAGGCTEDIMADTTGGQETQIENSLEISI
ncbi:regulator of DNA class I crossover intermediates 1 isoform X2 [Peromyscus maniculatus bairdii]|uniref:regulator of DNA class I crossover intermediates 1 isoform X2 n=2 Tax=Peromyscus maniculatus bairdii TaxID=230844 RepID=UPI003FD1706B